MLQVPRNQKGALTAEQGGSTVNLNHEKESGPRNRLPNVDVRVVLFTVRDGRLWVALEERAKCRCLPRGSPSPEESLDETATRILADKLGIPERYLEQLYSLSQSTNGEWTVSVTYLGLALGVATELPREGAGWFDAGAIPESNSVDLNIIDYGLLRLRAKLGYTTIAFHLLPPSFSLSELQQVYEAVLNRELDKRNFRRRIHAAGILEATGDTRRDGSHRPAHLYRFRAAHDAETYLTPDWSTNSERQLIDT